MSGFGFRCISPSHDVESLSLDTVRWDEAMRSIVCFFLFFVPVGIDFTSPQRKLIGGFTFIDLAPGHRTYFTDN